MVTRKVRERERETERERWREILMKTRRKNTSTEIVVHTKTRIS